MRIDHATTLNVRSDVDVHGRHAHHSTRDKGSTADARATWDHANSIRERELSWRVRILVEETKSITRGARLRRHIDHHTNPESQQDATLDPCDRVPISGRIAFFRPQR